MLLDAQQPQEQKAAVSGQVATMRDLMHYDPEAGVITFNHGGAATALVREFIRSMQTGLSGLPGALEGLPVEQIAIDGMVARTIFIPKGMLLVGKVHKLACLNIVLKGDISILTENGSGRLVAGQQAVSPPGIQKIGFANDDTVFMNVFRTDETTLEGIEDAIAWPDLAAFDRHLAQATPVIGKD